MAAPGRAIHPKKNTKQAGRAPKKHKLKVGRLYRSAPAPHPPQCSVGTVIASSAPRSGLRGGRWGVVCVCVSVRPHDSKGRPALRRAPNGGDGLRHLRRPRRPSRLPGPGRLGRRQSRREEERRPDGVAVDVLYCRYVRPPGPRRQARLSAVRAAGAGGSRISVVGDKQNTAFLNVSLKGRTVWHSTVLAVTLATVEYAVIVIFGHPPAAN